MNKIFFLYNGVLITKEQLVEEKRTGENKFGLWAFKSLFRENIRTLQTSIGFHEKRVKAGNPRKSTKVKS